MGIRAPQVDPRSIEDIVEQTQRLLDIYLQSNAYGSRADAAARWQVEGPRKALVHIFAHYCGLITDRLNRAPNNNFLAFLDLLGNSLIPAAPAHTALTFSPAPGVNDAQMLPAGTQVQADPKPGMSEPIVFETERALWLTQFTLAAIRVGAKPDDCSDLSSEAAILDALILNPASAGVPLFAAHAANEVPAYYFGLSLAVGKPFLPNAPVELFLWLDSPEYDPDSWLRDLSAPDSLHWQYCNGLTAPDQPSWTDLLIEDESEGCTRTGCIRFLVPADFRPASLWEGSGPSGPATVPALYWLRAKLRSSATDAAYMPPPRLRCAALNTVPALHAVTVTEEILGSSNGNAGLQLATRRSPVLPGAQLEVMERRGTELAASPRLQGTGQVLDEWVAWVEVSDFHRSSALDRHYVLDHQSGQLRFGDGRHGMVPPLGARNVRMSRYRTGGGSIGNVSAGALKHLVTGSRQVDRVTNLMAATGGSEAEDEAELLDRAPRSLRHRGRAVTAEDYEDLAKLCTTEVARALCVPIQNLARDPDSDPDAPYRLLHSEDDERAGIGEVSVIIVPRASQARPLPTPALMRQVRSYLGERASAEARVTVVGPLYLEVAITIEVVLRSMSESLAVQRELVRRFEAYLHPLTGRGGTGWPFGRSPHESDLYRLVADINGIDHIASLAIDLGTGPSSVDWQRIANTRRFLVCSGAHTVRLRPA